MTDIFKKISDGDLIEELDKRRREGKIVLDCSHDKNGTWYNMRENAQMSEAEADKIIKQEKKEKEGLADQFLRKNGIKKDKDGTPDIVGKVMGDYEKSIKKAHELDASKTCPVHCKNKDHDK